MPNGFPESSPAPSVHAGEAGLRATLADADIGVWEWDLAADRVRWNAAHLRICGVAPEAFTGDAALFEHLVHPDDRARVREAVVRARDARAVLDLEFRVRRASDGAERWVAGRGSFQYDARGAAQGAVGILQDVTERYAVKAALRDREHALRHVEERLRALYACNPLGVFAADGEGRVLTANPRLEEIWASTEAEMLGTGWTRHVHPDDLPPLVESWRAALRAEREYARDYRLRLPDGEERWVRGRSAPLRDARGAAVGAVGTIEDITDAVHLESQLRQAQKMEAVGQLAGGVAHDFNNLLTIITGCLGFLQEDLPPGDPRQQDVAEIAHAAERARALVRQLLAFSRKQVLRAQPVDLNAAVHGTEQLLRRVIGAEIALVTELSPAPLVVRTDPGQLEQALLNLAVNARDAMLTAQHGHAGSGGTLTIATSPAPRGGFARLTVRDSGHGMDEATRARLFEPFFTTKPVGAGTGLGLASVQALVQQSGGTIEVASAPGAGALFTILLPLADQAPPSPAAGAAAALPRGRGTLLLVEDEEGVRDTARRMLERGGYRVLTARHGADAARLWDVEGAGIDGVVTDLRMPTMGGPALIARLRAARPTLPVVVLSGYADARAQIPVDGCTRLVEKPFAAEALLDAVAAVVQCLDPAAGEARAG